MYRILVLLVPAHGSSTTFPLVPRLSRARCAAAASASGNRCTAGARRPAADGSAPFVPPRAPLAGAPVKTAAGAARLLRVLHERGADTAGSGGDHRHGIGAELGELQDPHRRTTRSDHGDGLREVQVLRDF